MANTKKIISLIREIVRQEVQKEVKQIFIKEGMKSMAQKSTLVEDTVMEVLPERKPKPKKKVTYTNNPVLNDILNDTTSLKENSDWSTMNFKSEMAQSFGQPKIPPVTDIQGKPVDTSNKNVATVVNAMTKDYSQLMKAIDKKKGKR